MTNREIFEAGRMSPSEALKRRHAAQLARSESRNIEACLLYKHGYGVTAIADKLGVSKRQTYRYLKATP